MPHSHTMDITDQLNLCARIREHNTPGRLACVETYGCQQNEADSEQLLGYLDAMGFSFTVDRNRADLVILNTCAIRDHAEQRVFGKIGALNKQTNPNQIICVCGCMAQRAAVVEKIKRSFPRVDLVFGTHMLWNFPTLLLRVLQQKERVFETPDSDGMIVEGIPVLRQDKFRAWVSIMYGCNNFCSYCVVPYVRGRERSRNSADIINEVRGLIADGFREITLLGQNVNSYGKDTHDLDFSGLLETLNALDGDFLIRFMTSHPKDAGERLFDTMAACEKVAPQLHLPVQSGSSRVLSAMNRGYTREHYLDLIAALRHRMPDLVLTSDIIVGFPGESQAEFEETLSLLTLVRYDALFTFLFSPRSGTPAALLDDPMPQTQKHENFERLLRLQNDISAERHRAYRGKTIPCLVDGMATDGIGLSARTPGGRLVHLREGDPALIGRVLPITITDASSWSLFGKEDFL